MPARDQPGDLLEYHARRMPVDDAIHGNHVLFIGGAGVFLAGHQKLTFLISHARDFPADRRAIHVHIEHVQEDADAMPARVVRFHRHHSSVGRRHCIRARRNLAIRIAKKIQTKRRQQVKGNGKRPAQ